MTKKPTILNACLHAYILIVNIQKLKRKKKRTKVIKCEISGNFKH